MVLKKWRKTTKTAKYRVKHKIFLTMVIVYMHLAKSSSKWYKNYFMPTNDDTWITSIKLRPEWEKEKVNLFKLSQTCPCLYVDLFRSHLSSAYFMMCFWHGFSLYNRLLHQSYDDVRDNFIRKGGSFLPEFEDVYSRRSLSFPHEFLA